MARQIEADILEKHRDYVEIIDYMSLSVLTWAKFGLSMKDLTQLDDYTLALIKAGV